MERGSLPGDIAELSIEKFSRRVFNNQGFVRRSSGKIQGISSIRIPEQIRHGIICKRRRAEIAQTGFEMPASGKESQIDLQPLECWVRRDGNLETVVHTFHKDSRGSVAGDQNGSAIGPGKTSAIICISTALPSS